MLTANSDRFIQSAQPKTPISAALPTSLDGLQSTAAMEGSIGMADPTIAEVDRLMANYTTVAATPQMLTTTATAATVQLNTDFVFTPLFSDNTFAGANDLDTLTGVKARTGYVGGSDAVDYYRFDLSGIRDVTLTLTGMSADADLQLIEDKNNNGLLDSGEILASSSRNGTLNDSINKVLGGGTYFAAVKQNSGNTNYSFRAMAKLPQVTVDLSRVKALNSGIDFGSQADFYSKITIDGSTKTTNSVSNDNDISPNWSYSKTVNGNSRYVSIGIQMYDSDGGLAGADDRIDIDAGGGRDINVTYDLLTNQISGDVSGSGGYTLSSSGNSGDRAQAWFKVSEGDWYDRNMGDTNLENIARSLSYDGINRNDMIEVLRETKDYGSVTGTELTGLRNYVETFYMPDSVENLADKVVNGHVGNTKSGIGNLSSGSSDTQMENLIGKWFFGSDRPDAKAGTTYRYTNGSLFQNGISLNDVDQGGVGDCYFIASLGAAAKDKSYVINNMFTDNGDGTFTVRLFKPDGSKDYVTVDRYLPTWSGSGNAVYAGWGGGSNTEANNELWVALAEKAYAQFNEAGWIGQDSTNSYAGISGGWMDNVLEQISGIDTTSKNANTMTKNELLSILNSSKMLTVGFVNGTSHGVVNKHAYTISSYNPSTQKFRLHNPWGNTHADVTFDQLQSMKGRVQYSNS